MRNLKRALSLTLASVMLLGMMVVGSSAAAGYSDVTDDNNVEAIEVLQTIEVMVGDERGFGPERPVNRAEMAVVMGKLLNLDYDYYATSCPFNDVYDWARGYVGACYANKIVSGRGEGVYDPGATVTAVEAASMLMRALGYFQYANDVVDGFELSTVRQGTKIGIFDGVGSSATAPMTRDQVAKMVLNALQSGMVEPDGNTINLTTPDGTVLTGKVNYVNVTSYKDFAYAISPVGATSMGSQNSGAIVELGEKLYNGDLKLSPTYIDDFGRPSRRWEYDGKEIGVYNKVEQIRETYTKKVTGKDLYELLGNEVVRTGSDWDVFVYIDGEYRYNNPSNASGVVEMFDRTAMNKNNKEGVGGTGKGVLTQVFVDSDRHEATVAIINTYLAVAQTDFNEKKDEVTLDVYAIDKSGNSYFKSKTDDKDVQPMKVNGEDFEIVTDAKKDDAFLVNVAQGEIQIIKTPEIMDSVTLNAFKMGDWVNADGTQYDYANTAEYNYGELDEYTNGVTSNLKDQTYRVYLDKYGYMIGLKLIEGEDNYVFITGVDEKNSHLAAKSYEANAIFLDGTMETITYNAEKSDDIIGTDAALTNTWCTFTKASNGVYTLKKVAEKATGSGTDGDGNAYAAGDSLVNRKINGKTVKAGQYHDTTGVANYSTEINVKHTSLRGADANSFKYVYGNDDTVYLNTKVKTVIVEEDPIQQGIIYDVASVTTGIDNANLELMNETAAKAAAKKNNNAKLDARDGVAYGAYVLYDKEGYVIAAVTVADDSASTKNLVYVNSDKPEEHYRVSDDDWMWKRTVIKDGEEVVLEEVSDAISVLENLKEHNWYVVSYNAKGYVISAVHAYDELKHTNEYTPEITKLQGVINAAGADTVLYEESMFESMIGTSNCVDEILTADGFLNSDPQHLAKTAHTPNEIHDPNGPKLEASTFYARTTDTTGFYVDDTVKAVLIQKNQNEWTTEIETGKVALENFIKTLHKYDASDRLQDCVCSTNNCTANYCYEVSAVITGGRAQVVVIRDLHTSGDSGNKPVNPGVNLDAKVTLNGLVLDVEANTNAGQGSIVLGAVEDWLAANGYNDWTISKNSSGGFDIIAKKDGRTQMLETNLITKVKINLNGEETYITAGTKPSWTNYLKDTEDNVKGGASNYSAITANTGSDPVVWADNGKYVRTGMISVDVNGSGTPKAYQAGDKVTGLAGNYYYVGSKSGAGTAIPDTGIEITSAMSAGVDILDGYYKITVGTKDYYQKTATATLSSTMGGDYTNAATNGAWAKVVGTDTYIEIASGNLALTDDVEYETGYYKVAAMTSTTGSEADKAKGVWVSSMTADKEYVKKDGVVTFTITIKGTVASGPASVTLAGANEAKGTQKVVWGDLTDAATTLGITKTTNDTVLSIPDTKDLGTNGITMTAKLTVNTADVSTAPTCTAG